ncbi:MAG: HD domain-containing phosphohydrolase [Deltaproteobacteria bacterium]
MHKILAIDDKMDNLVTLTALLKNMMPDCVMITAQSGMEGIGKARAESPDVILLDVKMPEIDGFETCRRLKVDEITKCIPVIMITAIKTDPQSRIKGLEIGADAFLSKPIDEYELVSQVKVALRIKEAEDALREEKDSLERKVQERTATLFASEERHRAIIRTAMDGFWLVDLQGCLVEVNEAYCRMSGYSEQELLSMHISDFEVVETVDDTAAHIHKVIVQGEDRFETRHRRRDGSIIEIEISVQYHAVKGGYLVAFLRDITERKRAEGELNQTLEKLRKSLAGTIQAMSLTVETRDPYTAGHQRKVSNLARVIAQEMGLSNDAVDNIRMAGIIHDIGKISVPAEILSRPGKLKDMEFSLIKVHSQTGYDILKDVGLPYPIAEIVLQHHERLDGSGYPQGLKDDQILLEARIISVADVVEAIASHRPYRPGFGIDVALEEIEKNKDILYDEKVVEVCLKLFRENNFKLD